MNPTEWDEALTGKYYFHVLFFPPALIQVLGFASQSQNNNRGVKSSHKKASYK